VRVTVEASSYSPPQVPPVGEHSEIGGLWALTCPWPVRETVRKKVSMKVAVACLAADMMTAHSSPCTVSQPSQPTKWLCAGGEAVRVMVAPWL